VTGFAAAETRSYNRRGPDIGQVLQSGGFVWFRGMSDLRTVNCTIKSEFDERDSLNPISGSFSVRSDWFHRQDVPRSAGLSCEGELNTCILHFR
jgi:hypothetical protein